MILICQDEDPYEPISTMECHKNGFELGCFETFPKFLGVQARVAMPSTNGYHALETTETETVETGESKRSHPHWQSNWRIERNDVIIEKDRESYPPYN